MEVGVLSRTAFRCTEHSGWAVAGNARAAGMERGRWPGQSTQTVARNALENFIGLQFRAKKRGIPGNGTPAAYTSPDLKPYFGVTFFSATSISPLDLEADRCNQLMDRFQIPPGKPALDFLKFFLGRAKGHIIVGIAT